MMFSKADAISFRRDIQSLAPLSLDRIHELAPSVFAEHGAQHVSDRYTHISTIEVVKGLMGEGFQPVYVTQSRARLENKIGFTKHLMRFRHVDARPVSGGLYPELVLINSHDGLSSYKLIAGVFRLICTNGLMAGNKYEEVRVRHQGNIIDNVIQGSYEVMDSATHMLEAAQEMSEIRLQPEEQLAFARAAHAIRFEEGDNMGAAIEPQQLIRARRRQEVGATDLFTTFNIAQENIIKGGQSGWTRDANGRHRRTSMRAVNSIDENTKLNRALWTLTEEMRKLKSA